ncbi:hypothetical protein LCGC14_1071230 [marine sediment metagenome]|uniref:Uncharacterized protein n=1 Tax=marine sediment metagenome TaxID=412755 RepID=A0A0F9MN33_9ZZZZ
MATDKEVESIIEEKYDDGDMTVIVRELLELQEKHEGLQTDYDELEKERDQLEYDISELRDAINDIQE